MKNYITSFAIGTLALALVMSPLVSFAKENNKNEKENNNDHGKNRVERSVTVSTSNSNSNHIDSEVEHDKKSNNLNSHISTSTRSNSHESESKSEKDSSSNSNKNSAFGKCFKAYGHLVAPGWIKNNGTSDTNVLNCWLPFGINKKFHGNNSSPSADTKVPVISNVVTVLGTSTIKVGWKTNENTTDRVYYSTILPVVLNASTTSYVSNASTTKTHLLTLSGLTPNTTYYLVIESTDTSGNVTTSSTFSAHTGSVIVPADVTPPVISALTATPGASTTTIVWTTDELATSKVFYSSTNPLDVNASTTSFITNSALTLNHSISVMGLATSTAYYFKVQSVDASGNTVTSGQVMSTTTSGI